MTPSPRTWPGAPALPRRIDPRLGSTPGRAVARGLSGLVLTAAVAVWMPPLLRTVPLGDPLADALVELFARQCHQAPDRSVPGWGLGVCARCAGLYAGVFAGFVIGRPRLASGPHACWLLFAAFALGLDVATETVGLRPPCGVLRWLTGAALAYPVGARIATARSVQRGGAVARPLSRRAPGRRPHRCEQRATAQS